MPHLLLCYTWGFQGISCKITHKTILGELVEYKHTYMHSHTHTRTHTHTLLNNIAIIAYNSIKDTHTVSITYSNPTRHSIDPRPHTVDWGHVHMYIHVCMTIGDIHCHEDTTVAHSTSDVFHSDEKVSPPKFPHNVHSGKATSYNPIHEVGLKHGMDTSHVNRLNLSHSSHALNPIHLIVPVWAQRTPKLV